MKFFFSIFVCSLFIFNVSCGYSFQGGESVLPPSIKSIAIPDVVNLSSDPSVSQLLTESVRERFERYGVLQIIDSSKSADAVLKIKVLDVLSSSQTSTARTDISQQLNVGLVVSGELVDSSGVVLWRNELLRANQSYGNQAGAVVSSSSQFAQSGLGSSDVSNLNQRELSRSQQQQALESIVQEVARQIYEESVAPDF
jgi:Lipopolysaccharide-assembly